ncbi:MAG: SAM-dependent methyltransferase, partial [Thauera sp.]|nr:SAM-dependent methyltransferase [Thauera sp.]
MISTPDTPAAPSDGVRRFAALIAPGSTALDYACGSGRHARWLAARGARVTAV